MALKVKCLRWYRACTKPSPYKMSRTMIYYTLVDLLGNTRDLTLEELVRAIRNGILDCVNVTCSHNGQLSFVAEPGRDGFPPTDIEAYKAYCTRNKFMGTDDDTLYEVKDGYVALRLIRKPEEGVFEIPSFVSAIEANPNQGILQANVRRLKLINRSNRIVNMDCMFAGAYKLLELDLSEFSTKGAIGMASMFLSCTQLEHLDLRSFDTSRVTDMANMFSDCRGLLSVNLDSFNTSNVTDMRRMFTDCRRLIKLDLHSFDTSRVESFRGMFEDCLMLGNLDISHFRTDNLMSVSNMFDMCSNLGRLDLRNFDISNCTDTINFMSHKLFRSAKLHSSIQKWGHKVWSL